ncbi:ComF family protein [uncultured Tissierella sp.]|uniref:ComF family protein n=1 Tax=uncultured Tissierella sp. TaxID=448160 RepID=UPI002805B095|nr:ComF family protein [uncultured Tissierella sp.]MDU5079779.1 ComF family protein [Bacillota bacterium]
MLQTLNSLLFPTKHICLFCKEKNGSIKGYICKECYENLEVLNREVQIDSIYINKVYYSLSYNRFIREMMKNYKYNGKNYLYKPFGEIMIRTIENKKIAEDIDIIIYVPTHKRKEALRGYNQAELLAVYISKNLEKPLLRENLIKTKWTKEQSHSNKIDRIINLKGSFQIKDSSEIERKKILLVDDIITTGVTMGECSRVLINNGAKEVIGIALTSSKNN